MAKLDERTGEVMTDYEYIMRQNLVQNSSLELSETEITTCSRGEHLCIECKFRDWVYCTEKEISLCEECKNGGICSFK